jgi:hypothetical protein
MAERRGWEVVAQYSDAGISGSNALHLVPQVWRSLDLNPIALSLLRKRLLQLECA